MYLEPARVPITSQGLISKTEATPSLHEARFCSREHYFLHLMLISIDLFAIHFGCNRADHMVFDPQGRLDVYMVLASLSMFLLVLLAMVVVPIFLDMHHVQHIHVHRLE